VWLSLDPGEAEAAAFAGGRAVVLRRLVARWEVSDGTVLAGLSSTAVRVGNVRRYWRHGSALADFRERARLMGAPLPFR
jgi:hypothetical protein